MEPSSPSLTARVSDPDALEGISEAPGEAGPAAGAESDPGDKLGAGSEGQAGSSGAGPRSSPAGPVQPARKPKRPAAGGTASLPPPERQEEKRPRKRREVKSASDTVTAEPGAAAGQVADTSEASPGAAPATNATQAAIPLTTTPGAPVAQAAVVATPVDDDPISDERVREVQRLQRELDVLREQCLQQKNRLHGTRMERFGTRRALSGLLVQQAKHEAADERDRVAAARYQLGYCRQLAPQKVLWEGGYEAEALAKLKDRNKEDRQLVVALSRKLAKQARERVGRESEKGDGAGGEDDDELWEAREISNSRLLLIQREEMQVKEREQRLHVEQALHLKRVQRLEAAERSNFRTYPLLADERYQLLNMIGRGGFSEVYRAYDLENNRFCAVKIHELGKDMSDQQRQSYIRRAMREYEIQKSLKHIRVVTLQDCFAISTKAFGTVLELCEGETLDEYLKRYNVLPEREARGIVIQILSGLKYMNTDRRKIIHYDLKPSNLFYNNGEIKIADFGLSKVVQETVGSDSIELTSQGAGTYWYLPPECFGPLDGQAEQPKISNKVDVWSTGVIFFELLFGRRPFGHGQSQEVMMRATVAGNQRFEVDIPALPKATSPSPDAKEYLKRLLTVSREVRPDVIEAFNDPYLRSSSRSSRPPNVGVLGSLVGNVTSTAIGPTAISGQAAATMAGAAGGVGIASTAG